MTSMNKSPNAHVAVAPRSCWSSKGQRLLGWLEFGDRIRETSEAAVKRLKQIGINVVMLTGDREEVALTVAETVGITEVVAGVKPDEKAEHIRRLQEDGVVAMIGDGINDAAALTVANVGIAMGAGSEIALESADMVLVRNDLADAVAGPRTGPSDHDPYSHQPGVGLHLQPHRPASRHGAAVPVDRLATPTAFAAAAMSLSSVSVVSNSWCCAGGNPARLRSGEFDEIVRGSSMARDAEGMTCGCCSGPSKLKANPNVLAPLSPSMGTNRRPDHRP